MGCDCEEADKRGWDALIINTLILVNGKRVFEGRPFVTCCPYCDKVLERVDYGAAPAKVLRA